MNRRIRWLGVVLVVCFGLLFLQLNNFQLRQASRLAQNPNNPQNPVNPYSLPRGDILSSDGTVLAYSKPTSDGYGEKRIYPAATATLFAGLTGYAAVATESAYGIESQYDSYLTQHDSAVTTLGQLLTQHTVTDDVTLTVSVALQKVAEQALAGRTGAVVAIDPQTGAILAMYGNPTYDPNAFAAHSYSSVISNYDKIVNSPSANSIGSALINRATGWTYAPGSAFKVVTTSAIFDHKASIANINWPVVPRISLPQTTLTLQNYLAEPCGGDLGLVLARSCDTAYGQIGMDLGPAPLYQEATAFGFDSRPPLDLPSGEVAPSNFPSEQQLIGNSPSQAYSAIGQQNVSATVLQMALVVSAIADNGVIMTPHLVSHIIDNQGNLVSTYVPHPWLQATSAATAAKVRSLMLGVTQNPLGTAYNIFPSNLQVAAKTGTAQIQANGCGTYNWLVATAPAGAGQTSTVAVAAVVPVPSGPGCTNVTGAQIAGPVVSTVLQAALSQQGAQK